MRRTSDDYDAICDRWDQYRKQTKINPCIIQFGELLKPKGKILDIGCGTGYPIDAYLASLSFEVTGIDVSGKMIDKAKALHLQNSEFMMTDLMDFQTSHRYDGIIAFDSLWHVAYEKQKDIYQILASLLHIGGYLIFTHGKSNGEVVGKMFDVSFYYAALDVQEVSALLIQNGFQIVELLEDLEEETTGQRELLIIAKKISE